MKTVVLRVKFRGFTFAPGTPSAIKWAEKKAGFTFGIAQGGYHVGVAASSGTHDKDAVDFSVRLLSHDQIALMVKSLRDAGFAAWHRTIDQGFDSEHVHAIRVGSQADLSRVALQQAEAFDNHRDGLKDNAPDNSYHPNPKVRWGTLVNKPVTRT
jgi:hypothetical protein